MLIGHSEDGVNGSFIDRTSRAVGFMKTEKSYEPNTFAGLSYGCYRKENESGKKFGWYFTYFGSLNSIAEVSKKYPSEEEARKEIEAAFSRIFGSIDLPKMSAQVDKKGLIEDATVCPI